MKDKSITWDQQCSQPAQQCLRYIGHATSAGRLCYQAQLSGSVHSSLCRGCMSHPVAVEGAVGVLELLREVGLHRAPLRAGPAAGRLAGLPRLPACRPLCCEPFLFERHKHIVMQAPSPSSPCIPSAKAPICALFLLDSILSWQIACTSINALWASGYNKPA